MYSGTHNNADMLQTIHPRPDKLISVLCLGIHLVLVVPGDCHCDLMINSSGSKLMNRLLTSVRRGSAIWTVVGVHSRFSMLISCSPGQRSGLLDQWMLLAQYAILLVLLNKCEFCAPYIVPDAPRSSTLSLRPMTHLLVVCSGRRYLLRHHTHC
ncbi:hypothetical protein OH76DRAFT_487087 [Lentinus brumalis]|uniref:Uncharacterized protein n=1 Tax=Lentinus brumalis TaxID=2498619 RepID=A0A371DCG5_9APHY|nr:hypothetical protein OH76DRAFT_487087 [Polyporus brumalis]